MQIVVGIKNATATQLDVADIGSLSDLVSQVSFILILSLLNKSTFTTYSEDKRAGVCCKQKYPTLLSLARIYF